MSRIFNVKLWMLGVAYIIFFTAALYGCGGDTNSQSATGGGSNFNAGEDIGNSGNTNPVSAEDDGGSAGISGGYIPQQCTVAPPALPGCSTKSFEECTCYDPNNPAQSG